MSKETPEGQHALAPAQLTFSADDARVLEALFDLMQRPHADTVRAAARLAAIVLDDAKRASGRTA